MNELEFGLAFVFVIALLCLWWNGDLSYDHRKD
jgi:hypothetical protein